MAPGKSRKPTRAPSAARPRGSTGAEPTIALGVPDRGRPSPAPGPDRLPPDPFTEGTMPRNAIPLRPVSGSAKTAAFLTLQNPGSFVIDDDLAREPLEALGWAVESIPWDAPQVDWGRFDLAVIRSAWDYHRRLPEFLAVLEEIRGAGTSVANPIPLVRHNTDKRYLRELGEAGFPVVPTLWLEGGLPRGGLAGILDRLDAPEVVLKPLVGAGAEDTLRIHREELSAREGEVTALFGERGVQVQPFLRSVVEEGEYSLIYLGGTFSHAILKVPAPGDFRVQEEFGSEIVAVRPLPDQFETAARILAGVQGAEEALYARVDLVRMPEGGWALMELELVEPSLYLRMDPEAPGRFARALVSYAGAAGARG